MNEQEVWLRIYCAALQLHGQSLMNGHAFIAEAAAAADEGLLEFRKRARSVGPCETQVIEIPRDREE